jgi:hypothetical protein
MPRSRFAGTALTLPALVVLTGILRVRGDGTYDVTAPVVAALAGALGYLGACIFLAAVRHRARVASVLLPTALALAMGHIAYGLSDHTRVSIARRVGYPHPTPDAARFIYGHRLLD